MSLPNPPQTYDQTDQALMRGEVERLIGQAHKKIGNIEVGSKQSVIFTDTVTGKRYPLVVTNGALTLGASL